MYFLALLKPFDGSYLGHTLSKVYQYATIDEKVDTKLSFASIKDIQFIIQKCIIGSKKFDTWVGKHGRKLALNLVIVGYSRLFFHWLLLVIIS
jgi:hypothetical protein